VRKKAAVLGLALALAVTAVACSDDGGGGGDDGGAAASTTTTRPANVDGVITSASAALSHEITIAGRIDVQATEPVRLDVTATAGDRVVQVPRTAQARRNHLIPLVGLVASTTYAVEVDAVDDAGDVVGHATTELTTGALPSWVPEITLNASHPDRMAPGVTLFDLQRWGVTPPPGEPPGMLVALNEQGEVVWYFGHRLGAGDSRMTADGNIIFLQAPFGFREITLDGRLVRQWTWGDENTRDRPSQVVIQSPQYDLVSIHHEVNPQPDGNIMVFARRQLDLTPEEQDRICPGDPVNFGIREDVVLEITRDGDVVHEWSLSDIIDPAEVPGRELCEVDYEDYRDWAHGNAIVLDAANNRVIVSARHIDTIFAFRYEDDANGPSGQLLWSLGPTGTLPLDGEPEYGPHAPELEADGSILLFDNGNDRPTDGPPYSRAVRYAIDVSSPDPAQWSARQTWQFRTNDLVTGQPLYADFLGDADLLDNGNVLVGFGGIGQEIPPARGRIIEVVPRGADGGDIVWDVSIPDTWTSYRAERLTSLYGGPKWETDFVPPLVS
jgi:hypothetical protein